MAGKLYKLKLDNLEFGKCLLDEIEEGDRYRKDYGDVALLAQNLTKDGLLQPLGVYKNLEGYKPYTLVFGGRRYRAMTFIQDEYRKKDPEFNLSVSVRIFEHLSEYELRAYEYFENIYRKDLTWDEEKKMTARIHELQVKAHGTKVSTAPNAPGWSQADTANLMGKSNAKISEDLKLAKLMEDLPEINWAQFKNTSEVKKVIKQGEKAVRMHTGARQAEKILKTGEDRKRILVDAYKVEDFFEGVKKLDDHSIHICEIDPPYAIDLPAIKKGNDCVGYNEVPSNK